MFSDHAPGLASPQDSREVVHRIRNPESPMISRPSRCAAAAVFALAIVASTARAQTMQGMPHEHATDSTPASSAAAATVNVYRDHGDFVVDIGPIDLPAHAMHDMIRQPPVAERAAGVDGWLHGYRIEITEAAGDSVPHSIVHHIVVIEPQRRDLFTPLMLRLAAAGAETSPIVMPRFIGYRMQPTDSILVSAMVHNPTDRSYHGVHVKIRMPFTSASSWIPTLSIFPMSLDVMPPSGGHSFDVPPGRSEFHWEGSPGVGGRILGVSGHLHKYGVLLQLEDRTEHKILWRIEPDTDAFGNIKDIPISNFMLTFGLEIRPDHVYRLTAVYDNPTGATIVDGGMGALGGVFHPTGSWPSPNRSDALYRFDWKYTWRDTIAPNDAPMRMQP